MRSMRAPIVPGANRTKLGLKVGPDHASDYVIGAPIEPSWD